MSKQYYLNNINLFSSQSEFEENIESLNINDINLIPLLDEEVYAGMPLGFEFVSTNPNIANNSGILPLAGGIYSRDAYAELWAAVQKEDGYVITESDWQERADYGPVPFYSSGDGSTTFRVPNYPSPQVGAWYVTAFGVVTNAAKQDLTDISKALSEVVTIKVWDE